MSCNQPNNGTVSIISSQAQQVVQVLLDEK